MQIEVYPTDADALDAAAALVAERLRAAPGERATIALGGGRPGRGLMLALAARADLPWTKVDWFLVDERCTDTRDPLRHGLVARESLFGPRGVAAARIHEPPADAGGTEAVAAAYGKAIEAVAGRPPVLDVVAVAIGPDGALGALAAGAAALEATATVAVVPPGPGTEPARVTLTPRVFAAARHVVVTALGPERARAVADALRGDTGPASRLLPSARVTWIVDRDAASELLKDARPAEPG